MPNCPHGRVSAPHVNDSFAGFSPRDLTDISARSVPSDHFSPLVADRHGTSQEPTVFSVEATDASFVLARFFRSDES